MKIVIFDYWKQNGNNTKPSRTTESKGKCFPFFCVHFAGSTEVILCVTIAQQTVFENKFP